MSTKPIPVHHLRISLLSLTNFQNQNQNPTTALKHIIMDLTEELQSVLQALHWAKRNPLTFACILSWVCFNMILISMEQTHPILSKQAENMTIVTFYQLFFGIYCVRKAFEGYHVGRPFLLAAYFVIVSLLARLRAMVLECGTEWTSRVLMSPP